MCAFSCKPPSLAPVPHTPAWVFFTLLPLGAPSDLGAHPLHLHLCSFVLQGTLQDGLLLALGGHLLLELCYLWEQKELSKEIESQSSGVGLQRWPSG